MATLLGQVVGVHQVRQAARDVLGDWLPAALVDVGRQTGWTDAEIGRRVPFPKSWQRLADFRDLRQDQSPAVVVAAARWEAQQTRAREHQVTWRLNVYPVARGQSYEDTADVIGVYTAAVRAVCWQHLAGHPLLTAVWPLDERYDVLDANQSRTIAAGLVTFGVEVGNATSTRRLYANPPADPWAQPEDLPTVQTTDTTADVGS